jgi:hypothetical protein
MTVSPPPLLRLACIVLCVLVAIVLNLWLDAHGLVSVAMGFVAFWIGELLAFLLTLRRALR